MDGIVLGCLRRDFVGVVSDDVGEWFDGGMNTDMCRGVIGVVSAVVGGKPSDNIRQLLDDSHATFFCLGRVTLVILHGYRGIISD